MNDKEQVLVVPSEAIKFEGISLDLNQVFNSKCRFLYREQAEQDPNFKQIIPYAIICRADQLLSYKRGKAGDESRLHAKRSIGVGGHINLIDTRTQLGCLCEGQVGLKTIIDTAVHRELNEELNFDLSDIQDKRIMGLVNEDVTEVGTVHVGVIYYIELRPHATVHPKEDAIDNLIFINPFDVVTSKLKFAEYEGWSQICLDNISLIL